MVLHRQLKRARLVAEILLFLPAVFLFLDLWGFVPTGFWRAYASLQIAPALLTLGAATATTLWGVAVVAVLTLLFGRVYCSTLCPLGTLQDILSRTNRRRSSRRRFRYSRPNYLLHYGLLLLSVAGAAGGSIVLVNVFEPFSNFGRMTATFVRPLVVAAANGVVHGLEKLSVYAIPPAATHPVVVPVLAGTAVSFAVLAWMSYFHGRLFCNSLCPAGALLGLVSRFSIFRIVFNESACKDCGLCEKMCKASCIDSYHHTVDTAACVSCFDCFEACPTEGVTFRAHAPWKTQVRVEPVHSRRRKFLGDVLKTSALLAVMPSDSLKTASGGTGATRTSKPISPPGSAGIDRFTSKCTSCHVCVDACPTHVLLPSFMDYGIAGVFQPKMDYLAGACTYDCTICGEVCPTGAILPMPLEEKKLTQIGKATFVKDDCVVAVKKTDCGACAEHCPTKAVHMVPYEGKLVIPEVNQDLCIGCGACEHPCPTLPNKAIYVQSNVVHAVAKKPLIKQAEPAVKLEEGFPF
jgi:ferredoxin